jgi:8-oxo-dGTP pyrophosphatase MutT (NUDIX family)
MIEGACVVLENSENKVLLQLRENIKGISNPGKWSLFGGHINNGEKPIQAAIREIKEELDLDLNEKELSHYFTVRREKETIHIFKANIKKGLNELILKEGEDMRFFGHEELLNTKNVAPGLHSFAKHHWQLN